MDLAFGRGGIDRAAAAVRLDYAQLIAILAATQAASRTARIAGQLARSGEIAPGTVGALVGLFDPRPGWSAAARQLDGSFNPAAAGKLT